MLDAASEKEVGLDILAVDASTVSSKSMYVHAQTCFGSGAEKQTT